MALVTEKTSNLYVIIESFGCIPILQRNQFKIPFVYFRERVKQKEF
jgi:hypothetical protein